jgi:glycosyltransferase involved in cell wall biosynthesis
MRVACYYPWLYLCSGAERTILEVALRSRHEWTVYTNHFAPAGTFPGFAKVPVRELSRISVKRSYLQAAKAAATMLLQRLPANEHEVLMVHSEGLGDLVTFRNHSKPVLCYCHTPLKVIHDPYARDEYLKRNPAKAPMLSVFGGVFRFVDRLAWKRYSFILANSQTVRARILEAGLAKEERIEVLHPGVDCTEIVPGARFDKYFLAVARIKWWKNIELSIEAFKRFRASTPMSSDFRLIVAGQVDDGSVGYFKKLQALARTCAGVEFVPNPSRSRLDALYSSCYAAVNTTLNEDWGIVPIEVNAYAKPVIAVNRGGPTESQADGQTGFLVPAEPEAFARAMAVLAADEQLARTMGRAGRKRARRYDWSHFVNRIDDVVEEMAKSGGGRPFPAAAEPAQEHEPASMVA